MISKITGMLSYKGTDRILIDVHGIGYEVFLADSTLAKTPSCGKKISAYTESSLILRTFSSIAISSDEGNLLNSSSNFRPALSKSCFLLIVPLHKFDDFRRKSKRFESAAS